MGRKCCVPCIRPSPIRPWPACWSETIRRPAAGERSPAEPAAAAGERRRLATEVEVGMAPFFFEHCVTCGRTTMHWHNGDPARVPGGECDECGTYFEAQPEDDRYWVAFTNMTDLSVEPAVGQYFLG